MQPKRAELTCRIQREQDGRRADGKTSTEGGRDAAQEKCGRERRLDPDEKSDVTSRRQGLAGS